jgi:hypothetical protein
LECVDTVILLISTIKFRRREQ